MNTTNSVTINSIDALDFMASRLLIFKRILRTELCELSERKFKLSTAEPLVELLLQRKAIEERHEVLVVANTEALKGFTLDNLDEKVKRESSIAA
jgi:hypothetical protein